MIDTIDMLKEHFGVVRVEKEEYNKYGACPACGGTLKQGVRFVVGWDDTTKIPVCTKCFKASKFYKK